MPSRFESAVLEVCKYRIRYDVHSAMKHVDCAKALLSSTNQAKVAHGCLTAGRPHTLRHLSMRAVASMPICRYAMYMGHLQDSY